MLDPENSFTLDNAPQVIIYGDAREKTRFYGIPAAPRIAGDNQGKPLISLSIYGKRQGSSVQPLGGQFIVTTTLALTQNEQREIVNALTRRLAQEAKEKKVPPPQPSLLSPEWREGTVEVRLTNHLSVSGKPSMIGANECALNLNLSADDAKELQQVWSEGLPDALIIYQVEVNVARSSSATFDTDSTKQTYEPGYSSQASSGSTIHVNMTEADRQPMTIQGPVPLSQDELNAQLQSITF